MSICIGINDVWRQFDSPALTDQAVDPVEYEENLRTMIEQAKMVAKGVIVCTPYYMEPNKSDFMRARMQEYVDSCERLAEEYGCRFVNFQAVYDKFLQYKALLAHRMGPRAPEPDWRDAEGEGMALKVRV